MTGPVIEVVFVLAAVVGVPLIIGGAVLIWAIDQHGRDDDPDE